MSFKSLTQAGLWWLRCSDYFNVSAFHVLTLDRWSGSSVIEIPYTLMRLAEFKSYLLQLKPLTFDKREPY